ncbi:MAG: arginine deiminase family protein, partial [Bacteroidales bacterium]|nr:arginine deiminase family protein [Bacteroidales bacterium]
MKFLIKNSLLTAFIVCLPAFGREPLNKSERPLVYGYPQAEYHKAGSILMYTPGTELFDGVIHPDAGLYEKYFDIDKAADEHRNYISMLEKEGCSVHTVTNTLLSMPHDRLTALAEPSLTYDVSNLEMSEQEAQAQYKREVLASMSNSDLVRIIINRPTVILKKSGINTGFEAQYVHNPLMNMYFLRDQSITTPR